MAIPRRAYGTGEGCVVPERDEGAPHESASQRPLHVTLSKGAPHGVLDNKVASVPPRGVVWKLDMVKADTERMC